MSQARPTRWVSIHDSGRQAHRITSHSEDTAVPGIWSRDTPLITKRQKIYTFLGEGDGWPSVTEPEPEPQKAPLCESEEMRRQQVRGTIVFWRKKMYVVYSLVERLKDVGVLGGRIIPWWRRGWKFVVGLGRKVMT